VVAGELEPRRRWSGPGCNASSGEGRLRYGSMRATNRRSLIRGALAAVLTGVAAAVLLILLGNGVPPRHAVDPGLLEAGLYVYDRETGEVRRLAELSWAVGQDASTSRLYSWRDDDLIYRNVDFDFGVTSVVGSVSLRTGSSTTVQVDRIVWDIRALPTGDVLVQTRADPSSNAPSGWARFDFATGTLRDFQESEGYNPSPDGSHLLDVGAGGVTVIERATGKAVALLEGPFHWEMVWSPDGRRLGLARREEDRPPEALAWDWRTGETVALGLGFPRAWSPEGRRVAVALPSTGETPGRRIAVVSADGTGVPKVLVPGDYPVWSSDGKRLAFARDGALWEVDVRTGKERPLVQPMLPLVADPQWSPDGRYIAFRVSGQPSDIISIDVSTGTEGIIARGRSPRWSPDGRKIAFVFGEDGLLSFGGGVYTLDLDSGSIYRAGSLSYGDQLQDCVPASEFSWSPDSKSLSWTFSVGSPKVYVSAITGGPVITIARLPPAMGASGEIRLSAPLTRRASERTLSRSSRQLAQPARCTSTASACDPSSWPSM